MLQQNFRRDIALAAHWDGILLPALTERAVVDRLPIILVSSGKQGTQHLSKSKILAGTGVTQADAVFEALKSWQIVGNVQGLCFDTSHTTSSNAGLKSGTCVMLEQLLGHDLLRLAYRHHILELVAGAAFIEAMPHCLKSFSLRDCIHIGPTLRLV